MHGLRKGSCTAVPERAYIDGIRGVYELNRIELLRDVFIWAYERSCARLFGHHLLCRDIFNLL